MKYNYNTYIQPVLNGLGADARAELSHDAVAKMFIKKMHRPFGGFVRKTHKEVMINYIYWCAVEFYTRSGLTGKKHSNDDTQNFKMVIKHGKEKMVYQAFRNVSTVPLTSIESRLESFKIIAENAVLKKISRRAR